MSLRKNTFNTSIAAIGLLGVLLGVMIVGYGQWAAQVVPFAPASHSPDASPAVSTEASLNRREEERLNEVISLITATTSVGDVTKSSSVDEGGSVQNAPTDEKLSHDSSTSLQPPLVVARLCSNHGDQDFFSKDGQPHTFRKSAASIQRCDDGTVWKAIENGREVPDAAAFYFDRDGVLLDICQALFWSSGCYRFKHITCEQKNFCEGQ